MYTLLLFSFPYHSVKEYTTATWSLLSISGLEPTDACFISYLQTINFFSYSSRSILFITKFTW